MKRELVIARMAFSFITLSFKRLLTVAIWMIPTVYPSQCTLQIAELLTGNSKMGQETLWHYIFVMYLYIILYRYTWQEAITLFCGSNILLVFTKALCSRRGLVGLPISQSPQSPASRSWQCIPCWLPSMQRFDLQEKELGQHGQTHARLWVFWWFCFHFVWSRFGLCDPTWKPFPAQPVFWCSHNSTAPKPPQPNKPMRLSSLLLILVRFSAKPRLHMGQWVFEVNILGYQRLPAHRNSISTSNFQQRLRNKILKNWKPKRIRLLFTFFIRSIETYLLRLTLKESHISSKAHPCASGAARSGRCLPSRAASMISFKGPSNRLKDSRSKTKHLASASVWLNRRLIDAQHIMFYVCGCIFPIFRFGNPKMRYEGSIDSIFDLHRGLGTHRRCYEIVWICLKLPETPYWCRCRNVRAILWAWPVNTPEWHHLTSPWRSQFCSHSPATPSLASAPTTGWCIAGWSQWDIRRTCVESLDAEPFMSFDGSIHQASLRRSGQCQPCSWPIGSPPGITLMIAKVWLQLFDCVHFVFLKKPLAIRQWIWKTKKKGSYHICQNQVT